MDVGYGLNSRISTMRSQTHSCRVRRYHAPLRLMDQPSVGGAEGGLDGRDREPIEGRGLRPDLVSRQKANGRLDVARRARTAQVEGTGVASVDEQPALVV